MMTSRPFALCLILMLALVTAVPAAAADEKGPALAHMVFFDLQEGADAVALVEACKQYLSGHDGTVYFSAGTRVAELARGVNDLDFDVALHIVFENKAAHDKYQEHSRHLKFIEENKDAWVLVRVFDSYLD